MNPDIAWLFVAKQRRCLWIQGVAIEATGSALDSISGRPNERNAVDMGFCTIALESSGEIRARI